jgi:hypothetical protein
MTGSLFITGTSISRAFQREMKGEKEPSDFIAEAFKMKIISASLQIHE